MESLLQVSIPLRGSDVGDYIAIVTNSPTNCRVSIPLRGSDVGDILRLLDILSFAQRFPSPCGEVMLETGAGKRQRCHIIEVSIPLRGSDVGDSSLRKPYGERVSGDESTHLSKVSQILPKIEPNTYLKPFPHNTSTHLDEKCRVSAICGDASMALMESFSYEIFKVQEIYLS